MVEESPKSKVLYLPSSSTFLSSTFTFLPFPFLSALEKDLPWQGKYGNMIVDELVLLVLLQL